MRKLLLVLALGWMVIGFSPNAGATGLTPGGASVVPNSTAEAGTPVGPSRTISGAAFADTVTGTILNGSYTTAVYKEAGGALDYVYQFTVATGVVSSMTTSNFLPSSITDVSQTTAPPGSNAPGFITGTEGSISVSEDVFGTVTFTFFFKPSGPGTDVPTGATTDVLILRTTSTLSGAGAIGWIDGTAASAPGFAPLKGGPNTPEPASLLLFVGLSVGIGGSGLRRWWKGHPIAG